MPGSAYPHDARRVLNLVEDSVVSHAEAVAVLPSLELDRPPRARGVGQGQNPGVQALPDLEGKAAEVPLGGRLQDER